MDFTKKINILASLLTLSLLIIQLIYPAVASANSIFDSGFQNNGCYTITSDSGNDDGSGGSEGSGGADASGGKNVHTDVSVDFDENTPAPIGTKNGKKLARAVAKAGEKLYNIKIDPGLIYAQWVQESGANLSANPPLNNDAHNLGGLSGQPPEWLAKKGVVLGSGHAEGDGSYMNFPSYKVFGEAYISGLFPAVPEALKSASDSNSEKASAKEMEDYLTVMHNHGYFTAKVADYLPGFQAGYAQYYNADDIAGDVGTATTDSKDDDTDCSKDGSASPGGSWGWPFPDVGEGSFMDAQLFGTHPGNGRINNYHDGLDFGSVDHPGKEVHAIHGGKVVKVDYAGGLEWYVVTKGDDNLSIVYQEFASSKSNIKVKVDDVVKTGDVIGIRDTEHVHIGITKLPFDQAVSHSWDSSGGWIDPLETIKNGLKKGGSDDATGGLSSDEDSARKWIIAHESGGRYNARNGKYYGAYQLDLSYLNGDLSKENQDRVAQSYMKNRYGTWVKAKQFWQAHNWW